MNRIDGGSLTSIPGITVGHWTDAAAMTGCSVAVLPEPNTVAVETRGAAPGSRETALLQPGMSVQQAQAIVLTGGSAFGLATADGVVGELETDGRGYPTPMGPVPIVPAAVIFDLFTGDGSARPTAENGATAYQAASADPVGSGPIGAGLGGTVSKWRGQLNPGGLGSAAVEIDGVVVAAMVVVNAIGDVFSLDGRSLTGGDAVPGAMTVPQAPGQNTTLAIVATNAALGHQDVMRLAVRAQDAFSVCIRPAHTRFDGDTCFAVCAGELVAPPETVAEGAFAAVGYAIAAAVTG